MIKVSAVRSAVRRVTLVKAADEYSDMMNGYANAYKNKGIVGAGVRVAVNKNLRAQGYKPNQPVQQTVPSPTPQMKQPVTQAKPMLGLSNMRNGLKRDAGDFKALWGAIKSRIKPMFSAAVETK